MTTRQHLDAIYRAKAGGMTDEDIMKQFSVNLREIERAVIHKTGVNLNLYSSRRHEANLAPRDFQLEVTTVWSFKNRGSWATHSGDYRGNWSPYIPRNVILRYSEPGSLVLDQFCGAGTTAVEAKLLGRRCIARDISPAAIALARKNLDFQVPVQERLDGEEESKIYEPVTGVGDARTLHGIPNDSVDLICTHPPYADIIHYTDSLEGDLSFHHADEFIEDMRVVARECLRVLKPGSACAILIGDARKNKMVVPIGFRTIEAFISEGFVLKNLIIKRQHNCRTNGYWYSSSIRYNFLLLAQEYLPVFLKPSASTVEPRGKARRTECSATAVTGKPVTPEKMECKTTWVLPAETYETALESNLFSRYGGSGTIIRTDSSANPSIAGTLPEQCDLLYVDRPENNASSSEDVDATVSELARLLTEHSPRVRKGGHLIIRTKDLQVEDRTVSSALRVWHLPNELFRIRELIVVTDDDSTKPEPLQGRLAITHEYLLVYQNV